jgi:hypothetical protein
MKNVVSCRIVLLVFDNRPPVQVKVDDAHRYDHLRSQLNNYSENENLKPDPAFPLMSLEEAEKILAVKTAMPRPSRFRLRLAAINL